MRKIMAIVGVRPQIIKAAPVLHILSNMRNIELQLVHTGQHYDYEMSRVFFKDFNLPDPLVNLKVGSGTQARQTAMMMIRIEDTIAAYRPDVVVVFGDANTTLAGAISTVKMGIHVAHVEAGLRSGDLRMSEEINRILVDHCSHVLFAPTKTAAKNLRNEGIDPASVRMFGDTMVDSMKAMSSAMRHSQILSHLDLSPESYVLLTIHRAENVDCRARLAEIIRAAVQLKVPLIFPVHPRTEDRLNRFGLKTILASAARVRLTKPLGYIDMLQLMRHARMVITDSGGMQKEAFLLHVPCLTVRDSTEWIETLHSGANRLVRAESVGIQAECSRILHEKRIKSRLGKLKNPFGDGQAARRISNVLAH